MVFWTNQMALYFTAAFIQGVGSIWDDVSFDFSLEQNVFVLLISYVSSIV
jgi:hypothetical protein